MVFFSKSGAGFTNSTVEMKNLSTGENYSIVIETLRTGFGDSTIVFKPTGLVKTSPTSDTKIQVMFKNVWVAGVEKNFTYTVTIIKP